MPNEHHPNNESQPPVMQQGAGTEAGNTVKEQRRVSRFSRLVMTWAIFIPLTLPFMEGDFWASAVPQAIGGALAVAVIAWVVTVGMKPTRVALASTLCVAFVLYAMSMAGRFIGRNAEHGVKVGVTRAFRFHCGELVEGLPGFSLLNERQRLANQREILVV